MSRSALTISLLLVVALGLVTAALLVPGGRPLGAGAPLLDLQNPGEIRSMEVRLGADGPVHTLDRTDDGGWLLRSAPAPGAPFSPPWPLEPNSVRGLLLMLADLRSESPPSSGAARIDSPGVTLLLRTDSADERTLRLDSAALGGLRLIEVVGRSTGYVRDDLYLALTNPGPPAWRSKAALPGVGARTSRFDIKAPGRGPGVALARIDGRWFLRRPVQARASEDAALRAIAALSQITIDRFLDDPGALAAESTGLDNPRLVITAEEDRRRIDDAGEVAASTVTRALTLGAPADVAGRLVYASVGDAATLCIVSIDAIQSLPLEAPAYLAPSASDVPAANVGAFTLESPTRGQRRYERGISEWSERGSDGAVRGANAGAVATLLAFISELSPTSVALEAPDSYRPGASITLFDFSGGPLESVEFGFIDGRTVAVRNGQVFRIYEGREPPALLGL